MKAVLFAVLTSLAVSASAADSIYVTSKLTRDGEIVDSFAFSAGNGVSQIYRNIQVIEYKDSIVNGNVKTKGLEVGTTATITPVILTGGAIRLNFDFSYVRLNEMGTAKFGNVYVDQPRTEGYELPLAKVIVSNGEAREYRSSWDGHEYIYTISATSQFSK